MSNLLDINQNLHSYIVDSSVRQPEALAKLYSTTLTYPDSQMVTMPDQAQFIGFLLKLINAKKVIEVGVYTGYCTSWIAMALPENGKVIAIDRDERWYGIGQECWRELGVESKIDLRTGEAIDILSELKSSSQAGQFDAVFIDADKSNYDNYYEIALRLVRQKGLIIFDNMLWSGKVADPDKNDLSTRSLRDLTYKIKNDDRVDFSLITVADGVGLAIKR